MEKLLIVTSFNRCGTYLTSFFELHTPDFLKELFIVSNTLKISMSLVLGTSCISNIFSSNSKDKLKHKNDSSNT